MPHNFKYELNGDCKIIEDVKSELDINTILELYGNSSQLGKINIPANWELQGFNNYNGTLWHIIEMPFLEKDDELKILEFGGVDYFTDVWINENYVGSHEGYFQKFIFDISKVIKPSERNLLVVKVTSPREIPGAVWPDRKQLIKGIFNHHDCRPGGWNDEHGQDKNTGGIWNGVFLYSGIECFIKNVRLTPRIDWNKNNALINIEIFFLGKSPKEFQLALICPDGKVIKDTALVLNERNSEMITHEIIIENPELWNPRELGNPALYELIVSGEGINTVSEKFGVREVKLDENQTFFINKKRMFLRGTNIIPTQFLSELSEERIKNIVALLVEANINIVRVHAHVNRKELYESLDKAGIMVWQDFALQWTYDESIKFRDNAVRQIGDMVNQFYNHPSIVFWCCHNEPGGQIKFLDEHLAKAVEDLDSTRIIRRASNYEEHPYNGWYWGNYEDFISTPMGPLVTEFGAQALPYKLSLDKFLSADDIDNLNWKKWEYHNFQYEQTFNVAKVCPGKNIGNFIENSQTYQAQLLKRAIDFYRRKKNNGITGIFQFMFIDCWPSITWSVVDYYLLKKKGYEQLKKSFQPLYISAELRQTRYNKTSPLQIDVWLINDLHQSFTNTDFEIMLNSKALITKKNISVNSDSVHFISYKEIEALIPEDLAPGEYEIEFILKQNTNILSSNNAKIEVIQKMITWS